MNEMHNVILTSMLIALFGWVSVSGAQTGEGGGLMIKNEPRASENNAFLQIGVKANGKIMVFELNDSPAAGDLYAQLPLRIEVENYSTNEKIFYPPKKLNTGDTPQADGGQPGTLAYYAPWGNVVMFFGSFRSAPGLYALGHAVSGSEHIRGMTGMIQVEKVSVP